MNTVFGRLFRPRHARAPKDVAGGDLCTHYRNLVERNLLQCGVACDSLQIEVRRVDRAVDRKPVYAAMVYLARWERISALRLLLALPLIEARMREAARCSWMSSQSHFVGLWIHASAHLSAPSDELRQLVLQLTATDLCSASQHSTRSPVGSAEEGRGCDDAQTERSWPLSW